MDHILSCMLDTGYGQPEHQHPDYIEKAPASLTVDPSQQPQQQQQQQQQPEQQTPEKPYVWRMYSQTERKYQLFPKDKQQLPATPGKGLDPEQAFALAMGQSSNGAGADKTAAPANGLRFRIKEHNLTRRRKISVPELGPMTTVQEIAMDSPTIPGRPPLHERSISAPGNWRQHHLVDCMIPQTVFDEMDELTTVSENQFDPPRCNSAQAVLSPSLTTTDAAAVKATIASANSTPHHPLSPKSLAPLVIPPPQLHSSSSRPTFIPLSSQSSRFRAGSNSAESALRSARSDDSPRNRTPFTPLSASLLFAVPLSAASATSSISTPLSATSTLPTPLSAVAPPVADSRASPKPRAAADTNYAIVISTTKSSNTTCAAAADADTPKATATTCAAAAASAEKNGEQRATPNRSFSMRAGAATGHRRGLSESGSIMERGRPRKRSASREGASTSLGIASTTTVMSSTPTPMFTSSAITASPGSTSVAASCASGNTGAPLKRSASKTSRSAERRAFELLPRGWKAPEAAAMLGTTETVALAAQALQQAARFEVLRREDVENLSRELRSLDERTEYLRRTYTSLRAGRRNLHSRICQYLRSPRVARFSHDSMLRQEEALAELDASIDDWVTKLEQAENRRTRVRQKLLEHVAAAATLPLVGAEVAAAVASAGTGAGVGAGCGSSGISIGTSVVGVSESLQMAMGLMKSTGVHGSATNSAATSPKQGHHVANMCTPPRSPTKMGYQTVAAASAAAAATGSNSRIVTPVSSSPSPSPQRPIVAQVPSTILEQPMIEEAMAIGEREERERLESAAGEATHGEDMTSFLNVMDSPAPSMTSRRVDVESIRIYAGDDVYALLADVESQITQMGGHDGSGSAADGTILEEAGLSDEERKNLHRAQSHELLSGRCSAAGSRKVTPVAAAAAASAASPAAGDVAEIFLTNAVFQPERSVLAI